VKKWPTHLNLIDMQSCHIWHLRIRIVGGKVINCNIALFLLCLHLWTCVFDILRVYTVIFKLLFLRSPKIWINEVGNSCYSLSTFLLNHAFLVLKYLSKCNLLIQLIYLRKTSLGEPTLAKCINCSRSFEALGGNSQNFLGKFIRLFVTLRCFYRVVIHRK